MNRFDKNLYECLHYEYANTQRSLKVTKGHFYVYFNLHLRSYGQIFVLVLLKI